MDTRKLRPVTVVLFRSKLNNHCFRTIEYPFEIFISVQKRGQVISEPLFAIIGIVTIIPYIIVWFVSEDKK